MGNGPYVEIWVQVPVGVLDASGAGGPRVSTDPGLSWGYSLSSASPPTSSPSPETAPSAFLLATHQYLPHPVHSPPDEMISTLTVVTEIDTEMA